jgi:hypothetical protein
LKRWNAISCILSTIRLFVKFVLAVLVFRAKIKKSATLYGDLPYWCLNIFSHIRNPIISI